MCEKRKTKIEKTVRHGVKKFGEKRRERWNKKR